MLLGGYMELLKVQIKNWQTFSNVSLECKNFLVFIGESSTGKSSFMKALLYFFQARNLHKGDIKNPDLPLEIIGTLKGEKGHVFQLRILNNPYQDTRYFIKSHISKHEKDNRNWEEIDEKEYKKHIFGVSIKNSHSMIELIFSAVGLGFMLSLVFIGPVFFLLVETSLSRGSRHALALDLGVVFADIVCIVAAYFSSQDIIHIIDQYPSFYRISALIIFVYGIYMIVSKTRMHIAGEERLINQNYLKTFLNGFLLNILNIGVVLFWLVTVIFIRKNYPDTGRFLLYICLVIGTYLLIDLAKIYLAKQFHNKLNQQVANKIRKGVGFILLVLSVFIFLQSFKSFNQLDKRLEEKGIKREEIK